eukprot:TRINITY_DN3506_c0_g1_i1.p2 TRINITY_DN3506_c0_g1~~TRINITY_DN3506_c0_g1_i1.p2  ORF type:complete len:283 (+),score=19.83 TRINITY_DN3506_c0_g1_i1:122-970(+)
MATQAIQTSSLTSCASAGRSGFRSELFPRPAARPHGPHDVARRARKAGVCAVRATVEATPEASPSKKSFRPGERKGFIEEMRIRAMKLHTKDQAKDGEKETKEKPMGQWQPTKAGFVQFLVDSKAVFDTLEDIVRDGDRPEYKRFLNTGLERSAALATDLAWFESQGFEIPAPDEAGASYSALLRDLAARDPPAFICHFYNVYFAHSAGGRMIGKKVCDMILDGREMAFYRWDGDLPEMLAAVKETINEVAEEWTREQKDHCLDETEKSFKYSGQIVRLLAS